MNTKQELIYIAIALFIAAVTMVFLAYLSTL